MSKRKICVVTGSRAEYGLLCWLMKSIKEDLKLELQIVATGTHLSPEFGLTYREIENDGFKIDKKVELLLSSDTASAVAKSTGLGVIGFADAFADLRPDIVIVLGDRFECLAAAIAALFARLPIGHIHGGETTEGAFDEAIRHSITKMAWWHFVAAEEYQNRVIQLGEDPKRVYLVGGLGVDGIKKSRLLGRPELEKSLGIHFGTRNLLVTYHPVTLEKDTAQLQFAALLGCLAKLEDTKIIFTLSNADTGGRAINGMIHAFVETYPSMAKAFTSMGQLNYLSTLQFVDAVVGNSSSGLMEAPTFKIGTINMGDRQRGRLKADSVIDCAPNERAIRNALKWLYSGNFREKLSMVRNPYGDGNATEKILEILKTEPIPQELKKEFYDL
jgi:GDP/UDP-N,N'-diacetylbacillosamine 2-epimerase (hydrolysing)